MKQAKPDKTSPKASANSRRIWHVLRNIAFVILLTLLILQILLTFSLQSDPEKLVDRMPFSLLEITSDSMYPKFHTGDGVLETKPDFSTLKTGDIITFYQSGELVTHEIVSVNEDGTVTTEGIANNIPDNPVTESVYAGKVLLILPGLSRFLSLTYGAGRKVIWIVLFIVILFGPELFSKLYDRVALKKSSAVQNNRDRKM